MEKLLNPELIKAAASSTLGILSLMCVIIAALALAFFRDSPLWAKLTVFLLLFAGVAGFGYSTVKQKEDKPVKLHTAPQTQPVRNDSVQATEKPKSALPDQPPEISKAPSPKKINKTDSVALLPKKQAQTHHNSSQKSSGQVPAYSSQGMKGPDASQSVSPALNIDCPEITVMDMSKFPPESRIERRCVQ